MLQIDDRFKNCMRNRLKDREYAERVMKAVTEMEDATLTDIWTHAALPGGCENNCDPEAMIGMIKGHDQQKDRDLSHRFSGSVRILRIYPYPIAG